MTARRCQLGPARKPKRGADARQPDLAVDPPGRLRCLTRALEEPGSERPQEERSANTPGHAGGLLSVRVVCLDGASTRMRGELRRLRACYAQKTTVSSPYAHCNDGTRRAKG